jgi:hypothetical protein
MALALGYHHRYECSGRNEKLPLAPADTLFVPCRYCRSYRFNNKSPPKRFCVRQAGCFNVGYCPFVYQWPCLPLLYQCLNGADQSRLRGWAVAFGFLTVFRLAARRLSL